MNIRFEITESSDWKFKKVLKIIPEDAESGFNLGRLFEEIHTKNMRCSAITDGKNIIIPLVERDCNNIAIKPQDDDEPPF